MIRTKQPEKKSLVNRAKDLFKELEALEEDQKIKTINRLKQILHKHSPFISEPVDCVLWVPFDKIEANDYNPNVVAPPEMELLEHSINRDGYTQPIVSWFVNSENKHYEVIDGFHRNRVGKECVQVRDRIKGYLPITIINTNRQDRGDRIAATIRHNRARGKHQVEGMSDIVIELKKRNWSENRIGKELGMEPDEVLRLCQISGLVEMFSDSDFSMSWDVAIFEEEEIEGELIAEEEL